MNRKHFLCLCIALLLAGCPRPSNNGGDNISKEELQLEQSARLLTEEPADAIGIEALRAQMATTARGDSTQPAGKAETEINDAVLSTKKIPVVLVGRVGGSKIAGGPLEADFPWDPGRAHFVISDPSFDPQAASEGHSHADDDPDHDCPFCKKAKDTVSKSMAYVRCLDENGDVLKIDARKLFELSGDELIVIAGQGKLTVGTLMIDAEKIYVRR